MRGSDLTMKVSGQIAARGVIDAVARRPELRCGEGAGLRLLLVRPDAAEVVRRFAEDIGAGDVRMIAVDQRPGVDQHHIVDLKGAVALAAVRQAGVVAERNQAEPRKSIEKRSKI